MKKRQDFSRRPVLSEYYDSYSVICPVEVLIAAYFLIKIKDTSGGFVENRKLLAVNNGFKASFFQHIVKLTPEICADFSALARRAIAVNDFHHLHPIAFRNLYFGVKPFGNFADRRHSQFKIDFPVYHYSIMQTAVVSSPLWDMLISAFIPS